jgi:glycosyltransferase involved in cell wall biosynthesis
MQTRSRVIIQYHGGGSPRGIRAILQRLVKGLVNDFVFVAEAQADEFWRRKLISKKSTIYLIGEGSTHKVRIEKRSARETLHINEDEIMCLWVGRLNENKDPLTTLRGFEILLEKNNNLNLYMVFGTDELLEEVKNLVRASLTLSQHVKLVGKLVHEDLDTYYSAADYFVLGSHEEGSGYALCEALACGCIPVVTDIPSFRTMTDDARLGSLWKAGDASSCAEALSFALKMDKEIASQKACDFFQKELSFTAIAQKHLNMYRSILAQSTGGKTKTL